MHHNCCIGHCCIISRVTLARTEWKIKKLVPQLWTNSISVWRKCNVLNSWPSYQVTVYLSQHSLHRWKSKSDANLFCPRFIGHPGRQPCFPNIMTSPLQRPVLKISQYMWQTHQLFNHSISSQFNSAIRNFFGPDQNIFTSADDGNNWIYIITICVPHLDLHKSSHLMKVTLSVNLAAAVAFF